MSEKNIEFLAIENEFLVINKPGGLLTQAPPGIDSVENQVKRWKFARNASRPPYLGIPHRLDRPVSGVMVMGQTKKWTSAIAAQFEARTVKKAYWAIVSGHVVEDSGTWRDWMRKVDGEARSEVVVESETNAKEAILHFQVRGRAADLTWLEIELETGRTHQIRLQCASRGHSIVGDEDYQSTIPFGPTNIDRRTRWIALHARELTLNHPSRKTTIRFFAATQDFWAKMWDVFPELNADSSPVQERI